MCRDIPRAACSQELQAPSPVPSAPSRATEGPRSRQTEGFPVHGTSREISPPMLGAHPAPWRSGYAAACKAVYTGSIPVGASSETPATAGLASGRERGGVARAPMCPEPGALRSFAEVPSAQPSGRFAPFVEKDPELIAAAI